MCDLYNTRLKEWAGGKAYNIKPREGSANRSSASRDDCGGSTEPIDKQVYACARLTRGTMQLRGALKRYRGDLVESDMEK